MGHKVTKMDGKKDNGVEAKTGPTVLVRDFEPADKKEVQRIFSEGVMEMVVDTAFRGLGHHPESLLLYTAVTVTMCWWVIGLLPAIVVCMRYFYSRRVIRGYLKQAMSGDMGDIEGHYMRSPGSRLWVAVQQGKVVGAVVAEGRSGGAVELRRMCVDRSCRRHGIGAALGQKVLEFAALHGYSSVVLGTTAYTPAAHQLYRRLGFRCVGVTRGYVTPGTRQSFLEGIFYWVCHHHYSFNLGKIQTISEGQH